MKIVEQHGAPQLALSGEIDIAGADDLRAAGLRALTTLAAGERLDIDLGEITFVDSSGLGALVYIRNEGRSSAHQLALVEAPPSLVRLLELTGLQDSFTVVPRSS